MNVISFSDASFDLEQVMDEVCESHEPALLKRRQGEPVVILCKRDYDGMIETLHLLNSPANAARLLQSVARIKAATIDDRQGAELKAAVLDGS